MGTSKQTWSFLLGQLNTSPSRPKVHSRVGRWYSAPLLWERVPERCRVVWTPSEIPHDPKRRAASTFPLLQKKKGTALMQRTDSDFVFGQWCLVKVNIRELLMLPEAMNSRD